MFMGAKLRTPRKGEAAKSNMGIITNVGEEWVIEEDDIPTKSTPSASTNKSLTVPAETPKKAEPDNPVRNLKTNKHAVTHY